MNHKTLKTILGILLPLFFQSIFCQQFNNFDFFVKSADKIKLSTISYRDQTTEMPKYAQDSITKLYYPIEQDVVESITKNGSKYLKKAEIIKTISLLKIPKLGHALPYQYDIQLDFYKKEEIIQTITISSYTKNLVIKKNGCKTYIDENDQEIDPCFFQGMVSNEFKKYIVGLLKKKKLWNKEQQFLEDL